MSPVPGKVYKYNGRMPPFPSLAGSVTLGAMPRSAPLLALLLGGALACGGSAGPGGVLPRRPPTPLDSMPLASDVRLDSADRLAGSFVGEGTSRAVHLLSSDTVLIATLARRTLEGAGPRVGDAVVSSPLGHTRVTIAEVVLRGSRCPGEARGARVELVVQPDSARGDPPLRGPVLGTFLSADDAERHEDAPGRRPQLPAPSPGLVDDLIERTGAHLDSALVAQYPGLQVRPLHGERIEVNTLADLGAADVIAFRAGEGRVRYAVSLRQRRVLGGRDTLVATGVMVWDSAGTWRQEIFRPTVLAAHGGRLDAFGPIGRPVYWRRLQPVSDMAYARDNIWMEQVNVRDGRVVWGIIQPAGNVVVAAAEVEGVCG